jgi:hypothetical protein
VLTGFGAELGVDPGRAASQAYRLPIHQNWYRATLGHNAVVVNGASQKEAQGTLLAFKATPTYALVQASCDKLYDGVQHSRVFCLTPTYALVLDELTADKDSEFDFVYHNRGTSAASDVAKEKATLGDPYTGDEFLQDLLGGKTDAAAHVVFAGEKVTTHLITDAQPATTVFTATGPCASVMDRVPMAIVRRSGRKVTFAAVIEPVRTGDQPHVKSVETQSTDAGISVRVVTDSGEQRLEIGGGKIVLKNADQTLLETNQERR